MLDFFSGSHILLFLVIALVVVGPKDLPRLMRIVGQWMGRARAMADQFRKSFDDMARQAELDELRKEIESLRNERPLAEIERDLHQSIVPDDMRGHTAPPPVVAAAPVEVEQGPAVEIPEPAHAEYETPDEPLAADGYKPPSP